MDFENELIPGVLIKRYKRFFADIKFKNKIITAHCPNTGSMQGLLDKGNEVWLTKNDDPNRKLKFTLEVIKVKNNLVGVSKTTHTTHDTKDIVVGSVHTDLSGLVSTDGVGGKDKLKSSVVNTREIACSGWLVLLRAKCE